MEDNKYSKTQMSLKPDKKKSTSRYIILKLQETNDKNLKNSQEKNRFHLKKDDSLADGLSSRTTMKST